MSVTTRSTTHIRASMTSTVRDPGMEEKEGVLPRKQFYPFKLLLLLVLEQWKTSINQSM